MQPLSPPPIPDNQGDDKGGENHETTTNKRRDKPRQKNLGEKTGKNQSPNNPPQNPQQNHNKEDTATMTPRQRRRRKGGNWKQSTKTKTQAHAEAEFPEKREEEDYAVLPIWKVKPSTWDKGRNVRIPTKLSEDLAEETGIHIGDGALSISTKKTGGHCYWHRISSSLRDDFVYMKCHVLPLIQRLYNVPTRTRIQTESEFSYVYESRAIAQFKSRVLGLPVGRKKNITIPAFFTKNSKLTRACVRGIADTDGTIIFGKRKGLHRYPRIAIKNSSKPLIEQMAKLVERELGVQTSLTLDKLYQDSKIERKTPMNWLRIFGEEALHIWMEKIGFANPSKLSRLMVWKQHGILPPYTTFPQRVAMIAEKLDPYEYYRKGKTAFPKPTKISQETLIRVLKQMQHQYGAPQNLPSSFSFIKNNIGSPSSRRNEKKWSRGGDSHSATTTSRKFELPTLRFPLLA